MSKTFVFIQLRGAMDGLAAIMPDDYSVLKTKRPGLLVDGYLDTKLGFGFHPSLKNHHRLFKNGELSFLHACGLPVRDRSHFKSQDLLETGKLSAIAKHGWLAEILEQLPKDKEAVAFGSTVPLILKGTDKCINWSSPRVTDKDEHLLRLLGEGTYETDPVLGQILPQYERIRRLTDGLNPGKAAVSPFETIGKMLAKRDGPDFGVIRLGNWDTHSKQKPRIAKLFENLDQGLGTLRELLRDVWDDTVIVIASEFGRSVHQNGTGGTDHGTGGVCIIAGGAVKGGQSLGRWPGLEQDALFEGRDVMSVHDIRSVFANIARFHFGMMERFVEDILFPQLSKNYQDMSILNDRHGLMA